MANWYKKVAWDHGIPLMDDYTNQTQRNPYKKDPRSLVKAVPVFGNNERPGYPSGYSAQEDRSNTNYRYAFQIVFLGKNTLMDQDPPTGEGAGVSDLTERFFSPVDKTKKLRQTPRSRWCF